MKRDILCFIAFVMIQIAINPSISFSQTSTPIIKASVPTRVQVVESLEYIEGKCFSLTSGYEINCTTHQIETRLRISEWRKHLTQKVAYAHSQ